MVAAVNGNIIRIIAPFTNPVVHMQVDQLSYGRILLSPIRLVVRRIASQGMLTSGTGDVSMCCFQ